MTHGLNFIRALALLFLPFVSILVAAPLCTAQTSSADKDEFSMFEEEIKATPKAPQGSPKPAPLKAPPLAQEPLISSEDKVEVLKKEIRSNPQSGTLITQLAEELYKKEDYEKATLLLWKHIDKIERKGLLLLAKAHFQRKEYGETLRALNIQLGKNPKDFEALTITGDANAMLKKNKDAMESFKKALELNGKYEPAYDGLIALYEKRQPPNLYELRILYQDMIENIGSRPTYLRRLCEINTLDGTFEVAMGICREAIAKDSKVADPYVYLALGQKAIGEDAQALATLKKAAITFPKSELAQYQYAKILEEAKNYVDAMKFFKMGTEADPKSGRSWQGLATSAFEIRKYELAHIAYKNACKLDKKTAVAFRKATSILRNQKNTEWTSKFEEASEACTF